MRIFGRRLVTSFFVLLLSTPALAQDKPVIGINCDVAGEKPRQIGVQSTYIEAVKKAGGIPLLIPPLAKDDLKEVLASVDGVLMIGGDDYPPESYGQKAHPSVSLMAKERSDFDLALVNDALADTARPFLGVCAGCQALNIGTGGSLIQDIPTMTKTSLSHASKEGWQKGFNTHKVSFVDGSHLAHSLGKEIAAEPTSHHQCVDRLGKGLTVAATSEDGLTEGIEMSDRPFVVGVQFHPERAYDANKALWTDFIARASEHRAKRH